MIIIITTESEELGDSGTEANPGDPIYALVDDEGSVYEGGEKVSCSGTVTRSDGGE